MQAPRTPALAHESELDDLCAAEAFEAMTDAFGRACQGQRHVTTTFLQLAARGARLRVAGDGLARSVSAALGHLAIDALADEACDLRIDVWDVAACATRRPPAPRLAPDCPFPFAVSANRRFVAHRAPHTVSWLDRRSRRLVAAVSDVDKLSLSERGRPLEGPVLIWLRDSGVQLIHAGCVVQQDRGVLFLGQSGSGKSTSALACARAGYAFVADDKVGLVREPHGGFTAASLNGAAQVDRRHLESFPELNAGAMPGRRADEHKSLLFLSRVWPARLRSSAAITALMVPRLVRDRPHPPRLIPKRDALLAAAVSTMLFLPIQRTRSLAAIADLVERVPCYELQLGFDLDAVARHVSQVLR